MCPTTNIPDTCKYTINPQIKMEMMQGKEEDTDTTYTHPHHLKIRQY
jgi:hypothetical protein